MTGPRRTRRMPGRRLGTVWRPVAVAAVLAGMLAAVPTGVRAQSPMRTLAPPTLQVTAGKPLMGENYDAVSGLFDVEARVPRWRTGGILVRAGMAYATSGRTRSVTVANPAVGAWGRAGIVPLELLVSLPLRQEFGNDDFATDMAYLSDPVHRERYGSARWGVMLAAVPRVVFRDGSVGTADVGLVALPSHGESPATVRARYGASLALGFSRSLQAGGRFQGTFRLNGDGGFGTRTNQDLSLFVRLPHAPGFPEISFRLPIDIDLQDFVTGVVALRVHF